MRKSQEVLGLSAIHRKTGKIFGTVVDLLFDQQGVLQGLLIEQGGWLRRRRFLPREAIASFGPDAIMVDSEQALQSVDAVDKEWTGTQTGDHRLLGQSIVLSTGTWVGEIANVYFLEEMGTLVGYELSDGWMNDLRFGRKVLKSSSPLTRGKDVWIATADQVQLKDAK